MYEGQCLPSTEGPMGIQRPSLKRRLLMEKKSHEDRLEKINSILDMLEKSPETAKILDAISELGSL